jgi:ribosomal protein S15P/S13E
MENTGDIIQDMKYKIDDLERDSEKKNETIKKLIEEINNLVDHYNNHEHDIEIDNRTMNNWTATDLFGIDKQFDLSDEIKNLQ